MPNYTKYSAESESSSVGGMELYLNPTTCEKRAGDHDSRGCHSQMCDTVGGKKKARLWYAKGVQYPVVIVGCPTVSLSFVRKTSSSYVSRLDGVIV